MDECDGKILLVGQFAPPVHGLANVNGSLYRHLVQSGFDVATVNTAPRPGDAGVTKIVVRLFRLARAARTLVRYCNTDIKVYASGEAGLGIVLLIALSIFRSVFGLRLYIHHHNFSYIENRSRLMSALLATMRRSDGHIFLCTEMAEKFKRRYRCSEVRSFILSNAAFVEMGHDVSIAASDKDGESITLGVISNLTLDKGVDTLLQVHDLLVGEGIRVRTLFAGPVSDTESGAMLRGRKDGDVVWLGPVYGSEKADFFNKIDLFVFPSRYSGEAQPLVLLEALSMGVPILATDIACIGCDHTESPGLILSSRNFVRDSVPFIRKFARSVVPHTELGDECRARFASLYKRALSDLDVLTCELRR